VVSNGEVDSLKPPLPKKLSSESQCIAELRRVYPDGVPSGIGQQAIKEDVRITGGYSKPVIERALTAYRAEFKN